MDKIDRLLDAVEHPDLYSDEELEAMLQDPETREVYDLMSKTKDATASTSNVDVDAEWLDFEREIFRSKPRFMTFFNRHAAAVLIGVVAALAAVAAGIGIISVSLNREESKEVVAETPTTTQYESFQDNSDETEVDVIEGAPEVIVFKEETLGKILGDVSEYYKVKLTFRNEDAKSLRLHLKWDQSKPLTEVVEMLNNFEQITITLKDNTLTVD